MSIIGRGCQLTHRQKIVQLPWDQHELHQYRQIHCWESWTDTLQKSIQSWQFPLPYKYIISEPMRCLATEGTWQWGSCMQIWCARCISPIHHLNVSQGANFVDPVQEKADKNLYCHKASWWHCALLMHLLEPRTVLWCLHHDVKWRPLIWLSTSVRSSKLRLDTNAESSYLVLFFMITSQQSSNIYSFML